MSEIALYYPYVHPREESWVKQAVLFWPRIQRIVPADYPVTDTPALQLLVDEGILTNHPPDRGASELARSFVEFVTGHADALRTFYSIEKAGALPVRGGWNDPWLNPHLGWIHTGKLAPDAWSALMDSGLAVEHLREASWLGIHPALAETYMCALAGQLSQLAGGLTTPVTDVALHHVGAFGWSMTEVARGLLTDLQWEAEVGGPPDDDTPQRLLASIAMRSLVPTNLAEVPIERILKLREHQDEFASYRNGLKALATEVTSIENVKSIDALAEHIQLRYDQTIGVQVSDLRKQLKSNGIKTSLTALSIQVAAPTTLSAALVDQFASKPAAAGAATAVGVVSTAYGFRAARATARKQSTAAWLIRIEEDLSPRTLLTRLRPLLKRFAP